MTRSVSQGVLKRTRSHSQVIVAVDGTVAVIVGFGRRSRISLRVAGLPENVGPRESRGIAIRSA